MSRLLNGYISLFREMVNLNNDGSFRLIPASLPVLVLICGGIGLVRNALSVRFGILPYFYRFDPDILWTMFNWPIHLFFFPSALLHWQLGFFGYKQVRFTDIFSLSFYLQILHLIIPFFDWLGYQLKLPWGYIIGDHNIVTDWYVNKLVMTLGIIISWWITGYMIVKFLRKSFSVSWFAVLITSGVTFVVILIPTYFVFPALNTLFNSAFGLWVLNPQDPRLPMPYLIHWGYGTYFAVTALLGAWYFLSQRWKESM